MTGTIATDSLTDTQIARIASASKNFTWYQYFNRVGSKGSRDFALFYSGKCYPVKKLVSQLKKQMLILKGIFSK